MTDDTLVEAVLRDVHEHGYVLPENRASHGPVVADLLLRGLLEVRDKTLSAVLVMLSGGSYEDQEAAHEAAQSILRSDGVFYDLTENAYLFLEARPPAAPHCGQIRNWTSYCHGPDRCACGCAGCRPARQEVALPALQVPVAPLGWDIDKVHTITEKLLLHQEERQYAERARRSANPPLGATTLDGKPFGYYNVYEGQWGQLLSSDFIFACRACGEEICADGDPGLRPILELIATPMRPRTPCAVVLVDASHRDVSDADRDARMIALGWRLGPGGTYMCQRHATSTTPEA